MADSVEAIGIIKSLPLPIDASIKWLMGKKVVIPRAFIRSKTSGRDLSTTAMHQSAPDISDGAGDSTECTTGNKID